MREYLMFDMAPNTVHISPQDVSVVAPVRMFIQRNAFEAMIDQYANLPSHREWLRAVLGSHGSSS